MPIQPSLRLWQVHATGLCRIPFRALHCNQAFLGGAQLPPCKNCLFIYLGFRSGRNWEREALTILHLMICPNQLMTNKRNPHHHFYLPDPIASTFPISGCIHRACVIEIPHMWKRGGQRIRSMTMITCALLRKQQRTPNDMPNFEKKKWSNYYCTTACQCGLHSAG